VQYLKIFNILFTLDWDLGDKLILGRNIRDKLILGKYIRENIFLGKGIPVLVGD